MTEQEKEDALSMSPICTFVMPECFIENEQRFVAAYRNYKANRKIYDNAHTLLRHGYAGLIQEGNESLKASLDAAEQALKSEVIPQSALDEAAQLRKDYEKELATERRQKLPSKTNIYLMRNKRNGYTKIGHSVRPWKRERTLQSQEPEVELIAHWPGTTKDEEILHGYFDKERVRGEWFKLSKQQIETIKDYMEGKAGLPTSSPDTAAAMVSEGHDDDGF